MPWVSLELPTKEEMRAIDQEGGRKLRFLVDESTGINVAESLKLWGYSTKYVSEVGLEGRSDEDVFAYSWKVKRCIVTHDPDFLDDRRFPHHRNPGIILVRPGSSGKNDEGLFLCLYNTVQIAGSHCEWLIGKKLDFSSVETMSISSKAGRSKYMFTKNDVLIWEEE